MDTPIPLHLKIEWNGQLKVGEQLSPKFTMTGDHLFKLESISCKLDPRLPSTFWKSDPTENVIPENPGWSFVEHLSLNFDDNPALKGTFTIDFFAQFKIVQDRQLVTADYRTTFHLEVIEVKDQNIVVETEGNDNLTRIKTLPGSYNITIRTKGHGNTLDIGPSLLTPISQSQAKNEQNFATTCEVDLDPFFVQKAASEGNPILLLHAQLSDGQERFIQIAARQNVLLGRCPDAHPQSNVDASDFVYRFYRLKTKDTDRAAVFLSERLSRNHLLFSLSQNGLDLRNYGNEITFKLKDRMLVLDKRNPSASLGLNELDEPVKMNFIRVSAMELQKFGAQPEWDEAIEKTLHKKDYLCDCLHNSLWNLGTSLGVNSLRLKRLPDHSINCDINALKNRVDEQFRNSPWWTSDKMANEDEYHFIVRMLSIGNNQQKDAIYFNHQHLIEHHATLCFCDNKFFLINHSNTPIDCHWPGQQKSLFQDDCQHLQPGMKFQIGDVKFHVYESYANYLNVLEEKMEENENT